MLLTQKLTVDATLVILQRELGKKCILREFIFSS